MARPKRRQREIEQTKTHILEAAARLFARKGFGSTSVQEISEEAGYSPPSLYNYFKGKQAILDGLIELVVDEVGDLFEVAFPEGLSFRQRLELLLRHQIKWAESRRDIFMLFVANGGVKVDPEKDVNTQQAHLSRLAAWIELNAEPQELGGRTPHHAAVLLNGVTNAYFQQWMWSAGDAPLVDSVPEMLDFFFNGILGPS